MSPMQTTISALMCLGLLCGTILAQATPNPSGTLSEGVQDPLAALPVGATRLNTFTVSLMGDDGFSLLQIEDTALLLYENGAWISLKAGQRTAVKLPALTSSPVVKAVLSTAESGKAGTLPTSASSTPLPMSPMVQTMTPSQVSTTQAPTPAVPGETKPPAALSEAASTLPVQPIPPVKPNAPDAPKPPQPAPALPPLKTTPALKNEREQATLAPLLADLMVVRSSGPSYGLLSVFSSSGPVRIARVLMGEKILLTPNQTLANETLATYRFEFPGEPNKITLEYQQGQNIRVITLQTGGRP